MSLVESRTYRKYLYTNLNRKVIKLVCTMNCIYLLKIYKNVKDIVNKRYWKKNETYKYNIRNYIMW